MEKERYITLCDGTSMGDTLIIFKTNAPVEFLKDLEKKSCQVYIDDGDEEVPIWAKEAMDAGYTFEYIDDHAHITPFGSSESWLENHEIGKNIKEHYVIENQP